MFTLIIFVYCNKISNIINIDFLFKSIETELFSIFMSSNQTFYLFELKTNQYV